MQVSRLLRIWYIIYYQLYEFGIGGRTQKA